MALVSLKKKMFPGTIVGVGVFNKPANRFLRFDFARVFFVEKSGTIVNWQGKESAFQQSIDTVG